MSAREFDGTWIRAGRIWSALESQPLPKTDAQRGVAMQAIMEAIRVELGCNRVGLRWTAPEPVESLSDKVSPTEPATYIDTITGREMPMPGWRTRPPAQRYELLDRVAQHWAERDRTNVDNSDMWSSLLVHDGLVVGEVILCRYKSRSGLIKESDRAVVRELNDRLAALFAKWHEISVDGHE